jgi:hypothetical protein
MNELKVTDIMYFYNLLKSPFVSLNANHEFNFDFCSFGRLFNFHSPVILIINENEFFKDTKNAKQLKLKHLINYYTIEAYKAASVNKTLFRGFEDKLYHASLLDEGFDSHPSPTMNQLEFQAVYLMHYKKSPERIVEMTKRMREAGFVWAYLIYQFDKDDLSPSEIDCWFSKSAQLVYKYSVGVISLYIKHYFAYFHISRSEYRSALVLEDDAWFLNSTDQYKMYEKKLPKTFDFFFSGTCCDLVSKQYDPRKEKIGVYKENSNRCTHAYYVSKSGALYMLQLFKTSCPIDHHINQIQKIFPAMEIYWAEPPLVLQRNNGSILYGTSPADENIPHFWPTCYNDSDPLYNDFRSYSFWEFT